MSGFNLNNSSLRICVDRFAGGNASGRVFSQRFVQPIIFTDLSTLALQLDAIFDRQHFPLAFQRSRTFLHSEADSSAAADNPTLGLSDEFVAAQHGALATFDVLVSSRRSSTWQGSFSLPGCDIRQEFSSFLELLRLVEPVLRRQSQ